MKVQQIVRDELADSILIASYRRHILADVLHREGFVFGVVQLYSLFHGADSTEFRAYDYDVDVLHPNVCSAVLGYSVLFEGCKSNVGTYFADRVYDYYKGIGALEVYWGVLLDA